MASVWTHINNLRELAGDQGGSAASEISVEVSRLLDAEKDAAHFERVVKGFVINLAADLAKEKEFSASVVRELAWRKEDSEDLTRKVKRLEAEVARLEAAARQ